MLVEDTEDSNQGLTPNPKFYEVSGIFSSRYFTFSSQKF